jgi:hypothetical protein
MGELAADVLLLLDRLEIASTAVVGLSMGGLVAMELAHAEPERVWAVALVATTAEPVTAEERRQRLTMADTLEAEGLEPLAGSMSERLYGPHCSAAVITRVVRMMRENNPMGAAAALRGRAQRPDYRDWVVGDRRADLRLRRWRRRMVNSRGDRRADRLLALAPNPAPARRRPPAEPRSARAFQPRACRVPARREGGTTVTTTAAATFEALDERASRRWLQVRLSWAAAVCSAGYAAYRGYYAAGGTFGIPGVPTNNATWRLDNLVGAAIVAAGAVFPFVALPLWTRRRARSVLLAICWLVAVFSCMHAVVMMTERTLSLAGQLQIGYPKGYWVSRPRAADLQDLLGNEPWFFLEGLAYAALAWVGSNPGRLRRRWLIAGIAAVGVLTAVALLSATGVIGKAIVA